MTAPPSLRGPFVGVRPHDERDAALFFGRDREKDELAGLWLRNRLTILHAGAGTGKTSLLRAGVIPLLKLQHARVLPVGRSAAPRVWPVAALPDHNPYVLSLLASWAADEPPMSVAGLSVDDFLHRREGTDRHGLPAPTLAAIDQVETFLRQSRAHEPHRTHFIDELFDALAQRPGLRLLLCVRSDYLDDLLDELKNHGGPAHTELALRAFTPEVAAEVVRGSLAATGQRAADGKTQEMLDELRVIRDDAGLVRDRTPTVDPLLLQVVGARLWGDPPSRERFLSTQARAETDPALRDHCARTLASIAEDHELPPSRFLIWLRRSILLEHAKGPPAPAKVNALVLQALEDAQLIDRQLIKSSQHNGLHLHRPRQARLLAPLRQLDPGRWPATAPDPVVRLRAAAQACFDGERDRARRLAQEAARVCPPGALRTRAEIETLYGNIAYEQGQLHEAIGHYREASTFFEVLGDNVTVGWLLAAVGRIELAQGKQGAAVHELRAAVGRVPNDLLVQTSLGQALWQAGEPDAALAVLDEVLRREADIAEARRARGEFLADLGQAKSALRDIGQLRGRRAGPDTRAARALALATLSQTELTDRDLDDIAADAKDSESGPVLLRAARVHQLTGDATAASELAGRAISARKPPLPEHQRGTARRLLEQA